jgi:deoxycytidylate deaminase
MSDTGRNRLNWAQTAINLAYDIAKYRSEDPYVQVGACIIKKDKSMLLGYNGAPSGVDIDWANRDKRRARVLHAEANVLNYFAEYLDNYDSDATIELANEFGIELSQIISTDL